MRCNIRHERVPAGFTIDMVGYMKKAPVPDFREPAPPHPAFSPLARGEGRSIRYSDLRLELDASVDHKSADLHAAVDIVITEIRLCRQPLRLNEKRKVIVKPRLQAADEVKPKRGR